MNLETAGEHLFGFLSRLFGSRNERVVRALLPTIQAIEEKAPAYRELSDAALRAKTDEFRARLEKGETLDDILPDAFAAVREAGRRTLGMRHFTVQLIGGMILHSGKIAEMVTGEGKTLVATLPAYLNALEGKGVHIVTVNDYLARRDAHWMGPIFHALGIRVAAIQGQGERDEALMYDPDYMEEEVRHREMRPVTKLDAYRADITYGTNNEYGFDYLRDNMRVRLQDQSQPHLNYAIVDEVDSILIDEARTPLIISGPAEESTDKYYRADNIAKRLVKGKDYEVKEKENQCLLTEDGIETAQAMAGVDSFYTPGNTDWPHLVEQALRAKELYKLDVQYVNKQGEIIIVDEFTGRLMPGRRWSDGLHQAVEAKEHLRIREEQQTLATITLQNYFKLYKKLAGMTGTALTEALEFQKVYKLEAIAIPPNRPLIRTQEPDLVFGTHREKWDASADEIANLIQTGRPVLVGTTSIENSELLSGMLKRRGIVHNVLNAKHHEREAEIVKEAGCFGRLTIATNMAGRGTDILLEGAPRTVEDLAGVAVWLANAWHLTIKPEDLAGLTFEQAKELLVGKAREAAEKEKKNAPPRPTDEDIFVPSPVADPDETLRRFYEKGVPGLGGLHILGTERHEARRIDNQLRGRAGRQGDPGSSQFFLSLEDDLLRIMAPEWAQRLLQKMGLKDGAPIQSGMVSRAIEKAQKKMESHNFDIRKNLLEYDGVMNEQRKIVYEQRQRILKEEGLREMVQEWVEDRILVALETYLPEKARSDEWDPQGMCDWAKRKFGAEVQKSELSGLARDGVAETVLDQVLTAYAKREEVVTPERMRKIEKFVLLNVIDEKWKEHLAAMDHLRGGIGLRGFAQIDPKVEYKREGYAMFDEMLEVIKDQVTDGILKIQIEQDTEEQLRRRWKVASTTKQDVGQFAGPPPSSGEGGQPAGPPPKPKPIVAEAKVGRNEPCPCGSGKKYKKCHGREGGGGDGAGVGASRPRPPSHDDAKAERDEE
ncbi:MAG: preprotein translocase subunit SecA [Planctomycetes bacterium]|nr:preprotein translocase subunit SecA [Planctomycetota bacterium]